eukprot:CAMPEP_0118853284 /NCGR_PEP_ID=MMETSP1163-20130328/1937_1 /TAXON_ID=124430 /ORGANISM="Phaeomonas parva, Strain CCMP2877" /LENGTH=62 /DNA_ID=CAMNT_0006785821 /DNA_START=213 /DNA_END=397 /DNA_ORIENTATION=+
MGFFGDGDCARLLMLSTRLRPRLPPRDGERTDVAKGFAGPPAPSAGKRGLNLVDNIKSLAQS